MAKPIDVGTLCEAKAGRFGGLDNIRTAIDRGDFTTAARAREAERWLKRKRREKYQAWLRTPDGSIVRQADSARHAVWVSVAAFLVSVAALALAALPYLKG
ncbi:hypothetical protein ACFPOE_11505 [Caenimonas terrae]|uniref:Uncharacterized protein n=1 Tax=Caenimonas terrae TaxID=696074 RepID=A0ABW0NF15_9BURK